MSMDLNFIALLGGVGAVLRLVGALNAELSNLRAFLCKDSKGEGECEWCGEEGDTHDRQDKCWYCSRADHRRSNSSSPRDSRWDHLSRKFKVSGSHVTCDREQRVLARQRVVSRPCDASVCFDLVAVDQLRRSLPLPLPLSPVPRLT